MGTDVFQYLDLGGQAFYVLVVLALEVVDKAREAPLRVRRRAPGRGRRRLGAEEVRPVAVRERRRPCESGVSGRV